MPPAPELEHSCGRRSRDEVILATSGHEGSWLARTLHLNPVHHLQRRWGKKLTVFTTGPPPKWITDKSRGMSLSGAVRGRPVPG
jgi:hypothetical protein